MKKKPVNLPASILDQLRNIARKQSVDFNFLMLRYMQERFLSRLAHSGHVNKFILKGGFLLLAYNVARARATKDIDFLGVNLSSNRSDLERVIAEIASVDLDDGVRFLPDSIRSEAITEDTDYEGVRLKLNGKIGSARNTLQIDVGFGDIVTPHPLQMEYPTMISRSDIKVLAYSKETIVAEKFEAIVRLTTFNTRMKDFFDIAFLAHEFDFTGATLQLAIQSTFQRRKTALEAGIKLLNSGFGRQPHFQRYWEAFRTRTRGTGEETFGDIFEEIRSFLLPVITRTVGGIDPGPGWNRKKWRWEE